MTALTRSYSFNDTNLLFIEYRGRPVVLASQLSIALGYTRSERLSENIDLRWSGEFVPGQDFQVLTGDDLSRFKAAVNNTADRGVADEATNNTADRRVVDPTVNRVLLLTESGAQLAAILSRTERGRAFRRFLVDVVLPEWKEATALPPPRQGVRLDDDDLGSVRYDSEMLKLARARETRLTIARLERRGGSKRLIDEMLVQNVSALLGRPVTIESIPDRLDPEQALRELWAWMEARADRFAGRGAEGVAAIGSWFPDADWVGLRSSVFDDWCKEQRRRRLDLLRAWAVAGYIRHDRSTLTMSYRLGRGQHAPVAKMIVFNVDRIRRAEML